jgi:hypothetical protein
MLKVPIPLKIFLNQLKKIPFTEFVTHYYCDLNWATLFWALL